ncbi:MAG: biopolymer transporter ExbD [Persephonella sp.]|nr:MAG: biopolymer transporter ExbD [Persephonella sp.]RUM59828.1 MAG: biopolymer transporter ExbD [Persephonella sp.]
MKLIDEDEKEISEINMTPFVDIVLVILIIFMATATFIVEQKIPLNLPEAKTGENKETENHQIVISITEKGLLLGNKSVELENLKNLLREKINSKNPTILLRADRDVKFQRVVDVIDICRELGLEKYIVETQGKY